MHFSHRFCHCNTNSKYFDELAIESSHNDLFSGLKDISVSKPSKSRVVALALSLCFAFSVLNRSMHAQTTPDMYQGVSAYQSFQQNDFDNVNVVNGNLYLQIPLLSYPQRGGKLRLNFYIYLNDKIWRPYLVGPINAPNSWADNGWWVATDQPVVGQFANQNNPNHPNAIAGAYVARDQHFDVAADVQSANETWTAGSGNLNGGQGGENQNDSYIVSSGSYFAVGPDGSRHYIGDYGGYICSPLNDGASGCSAQPAMSWQSTYPAVDGSDVAPSGMGASSSSQTTNLWTPTPPNSVTDADGITYTPTKTYDTNGNFITTSAAGWKDTAGRLIPGTAVGNGPGTPGASFFSNDPLPGIMPGSSWTDLSSSLCPSGTTSARKWQPPAYNTSVETYWLCYTTYSTYGSNFNFNNQYYDLIDITSGQGTEHIAPAVMLTAVVLPNGTSYQFLYDNSLSLAKMTLPTGGSITYTYSQQVFVPPGNNNADGTPSRVVASRTVTPGDGQPSGTWYYLWNASAGSGNGPIYAIITDPNLNDEEHQLGGTDANGTTWGLTNLAETQVTNYDGCSPHNTACKNHATGTITKITQYGLRLVGGGGGLGNPAQGSQSIVSQINTPPQRTSTVTKYPLASGQYRTTTLSQTYAPNYTLNCTCGQGPGVPSPSPSSFPPTPVFTYSTVGESYATNHVTATTYSDDGVQSSPIRTDLTTYAWQGTSANNYLLSGLFNLVTGKGSGAGSISPASNGTLPSGLTAATLYSYGNSAVVTGLGSSNQHGTPPTSSLERGNLISTTRELNISAGTGETSTSTWNDTGTVASTTDAMSLATIQYGYESTGSLLTSISNPVSTTPIALVEDFNTGLLTSKTDSNGASTAYTYDPTNNFVNSVKQSDGGTTTYTYGTALPIIVTETDAISSTFGSRIMQTTLDGFGRPNAKQVTNDPDGAVFSATSYDNMGRIAGQSIPVRGGAPRTSQYTTYLYDNLSRIVKVTYPDSTSASTSYSGEAAQTTDEGNGNTNVTRIVQTDVLGRMLSACEVTSNTQSGSATADNSPTSCGQDFAATGFLTKYSYDVLGNLTAVTQGSSLPQRTFQYDACSRLTSTTNPESGTTKYTYDNNDGVLTRVRPSPNQSGTATVTTTYNYKNLNSGAADKLHRLASISYADTYTNNVPTPAVYFNYDTTSNALYPASNATNLIGRASDSYVIDSGNNTIAARGYSYDPMGRDNKIYTCTVDDCGKGWSYDLTYVYTYTGNVYTQAISDSSLNNTLTYTYDNIGRLSEVQSNYVDTYHPAILFSDATYDAFGNLLTAQLGANETETNTYDVRSRPLSSSVSATGSSTPIYSFGVGYAPNGQIVNMQDSVNGAWTYSYDGMNRLMGGNASSGPWSGYTFAWFYDRFGNMVQRSAAPLLVIPATVVNAPNNQLAGMQYDAAGNLLNDGVNTYKYDGENRLITVVPQSGGSATYSYDAEGKRIRRVLPNGSINEYVYDEAGRHIADMTTTGSLILGEIYAGGRHLATYNASFNATYFVHTDWLGTERARSLYTGSPAESCTGLPFGDGMSCTSTDISPMHFTGKERDTESGLDYFGARYYGSNMGRFMSPDHPLIDQHPENPQSWNLYAYARNNPLINIDPTGLGCVTDMGQGSDANHESVELNNSISSDDCAGQHGTWVPGDVSKDNIGAYRGSDGGINFQATTNTGGNVYYSSFVSGAQTDANGVGPGASIAHASTDWLSSQIVGGSLDQMMSFAANRMEPRGGGGLMALLAGPGFSPDGPDNWAGPGGMGTPQGQGDWAAMVHDYNFFTNNITIGTYFNPFVSRATAKALIQSDNNLVGHAGGAQSVKMGMLFGVVNAFQWLTHPF